MNKKTSFLKVWLILAASVSIMFSPVLNAASSVQATQFQVGAKILKTKPARASAIAPLVDELVAYDLAVDANGGKAPKDAVDRLKKIASLAPQAKSEIRSLAANLKSAGETEDFVAYIAAKAKETRSSSLEGELRAANAYSLLQRADSIIDQEIAARTQAAKATASLMDMLLGVSTAEASFRSTVCGAFWFTISLGYGTQHAYTSCYA